ncbi:MAG: phosphatidylglycerophosphatase A [Candidatus Riflebacteria bacterium]|jgi:phosphatidylglycerophosphatase A|nr:phosphatidylglycerophosphatase A [Candidatus Riflebacteria bacterium]MDD3376046.1 phosphatidylglycerophosphatase A [Candidatus Riflebacteria bacterium]NCB45584.1 phosphatidylglycerophosphatase A [bacterium]NLV93292.1 phosphatidylglycerophosphatase A [Candidatus Riflebacteria bacterium]
MTISKKIGIFWETNPLGKRIISVFATCFGLGKLFPSLSSTLASLAGIAVFLLTRNLTSLTQSCILLLFVILAVGACEKYEKSEKIKSPVSLVIDKTIGMTVSLFLIWNANFLAILIAFVLFRFLEYFKPFPINLFAGFKNGKGVIADDLAAGMLTNFIIRILLLKGLI